MSASVQPTPQQINNVWFAKNTVPVLNITTDETITAYLAKDRGTPFFSASYQPGLDGVIKINLNDLYGDFLNSEISQNSNYFKQENCFQSFNIDLFGNTTGSFASYEFYVFNSVYKGKNTFQSYIENSFLTNQPSEKLTDRDAKEWLTFYEPGNNRRVSAIFYLREGGKEDSYAR